jgi:magnesium-transporting ATPase (P-type)
MQNDKFAVFISTLDPFVLLIVSIIAGYVSGNWIYKKNFYTALAVIIIIPYSVAILMWINEVIFATLPYLISASVGFWGVDRAKYLLFEIPYIIKKLFKKNNE